MSDLWSPNTRLLLHLEGDNGSTSFPDSSQIAKTVTRGGNARIVTSTGKWGSGCLALDSSGCYLNIGNNVLAFGPRNFCIQFWICLLSPAPGGYPHILSSSMYNGNGGFIVTVDGAGTGWGGSGLLNFYASASGSNGPSLLSTSVIRGTGWHFIEISNVWPYHCLFVDGNLEASAYVTSANYTGNGGLIGAALKSNGSPDLSYWQTAYFNDFRITYDVGRHSSSYVAPTDRLPDPDPIAGEIAHAASPEFDIYDGGNYHIPLNIDKLGLAGSYRTRLYDKYSGRLVREQWSGADGVVDFQNLAYRNKGYYATAHDHTEPLKEAAIADFLTPELMTA